jgi:hypothetical protein
MAYRGRCTNWGYRGCGEKVFVINIGQDFGQADDSTRVIHKLSESSLKVFESGIWRRLGNRESTTLDDLSLYVLIGRENGTDLGTYIGPQPLRTPAASPTSV